MFPMRCRYCHNPETWKEEGGTLETAQEVFDKAYRYRNYWKNGGGITVSGESKEDVVDMLLELREIQPEALPINFLLPIKGTPLGNADISQLTTEYCMKVLCLARLLVPKADIRCAAGREVYFKGEEKKLLIEGHDLFIFFCSSDTDFIAFQIRAVKSMHRLADLF